MNVNDLQYDWPQNVLGYEARLLFGLTVNELLVLAGIGMAAMFVHLLLGLAALILGVLMMLRFETFGNRRMPEYLLARLRHRFGSCEVILPRILPADDDEELIITDLNGAELARMGGSISWPSSN